VVLIGANDESSLLGCYAVATDTRLQTFRRSIYQSTRRNTAEGVDLERQHSLQGTDRQGVPAGVGWRVKRPGHKAHH